MYSERFGYQWEKFVAEFEADMQNLSAESITLERVNNWYKSHSFRWSSIAENEGILLDNEENEILKKELTKAIEEFSFEKMTMDAKPKFLPGFLAGIVLAVVGAVFLKTYLKIKTWFMVAEIIVVVLCPVVLYAGALDKYTQQQNRNIRQGYVKQLMNYKKHLVNICKKHEK